MSSQCTNGPIAALCDTPATVEPNNFKLKSLSNWSLNLFIGCQHACRFCYVTGTSITPVSPT